MQTRSTNQQKKQIGRNALGLSLLVQLVGTIQQTLKGMAHMNGNWKQSAQANIAAAGSCLPAAMPLFPIYRDESVASERSFSLRHLDWIQSIRGVYPQVAKETP